MHQFLNISLLALHRHWVGERWRRAVVLRFTAAVALTSCSSGLWGQTYATAIADANWHSSGSVFECKMFYDVSGLGQAVFSSAAGSKEIFQVKQKQLLLPEGKASIGISNPGWSAEASIQPVTTTTVVSRLISVSISGKIALDLRDYLRAGKRLVLTRDVGAGQNPARVVIEPIRFEAALLNYQRCIKKLLPVSLDEVTRTTVHFDHSAEDLTAADKQKLNWLVQYAKANPHYKRILIDGHTDSQGPRPDNADISKVHSEQVDAYLKAAGLSTDKIITRWHGERYPVATNNTPEGRKKNRRVTVRLDL